MKFFATLLTAAVLALSPVVASPLVSDTPSSQVEIVPSINPTAVIDYKGQITPDVAEAKMSSPVYRDPAYRINITGDFGGGIIDYIEKYNKIRTEGSRVRIDDLCMSACTLILGLVPKAQVCVSEFAQLAFHSAWVMSLAGPMFSSEGTNLIWNIYPDQVKNKLRERGWNGGEHPNFLYIKGTDFYQLCG